MRADLKDRFESGGGNVRLTAKVGWRRASNVRFAGRPGMQRLLTDIRSQDGSVNVSHLVMTVGREIPGVPIIYSRIVPGAFIEFDGKIFPYTRRSDGTSDYGIKITKLIQSTLSEE